MARFTVAQRARINRLSKPKDAEPGDDGGELNIIPFLDIITNVLMFLLATIATVFTASIPVPQPSSNTGHQSDDTHRLNITVKIQETGFIVGAGGGFLQAGCSTIGAATVTVPNRGSADVDGYTHDFEGLTHCMENIRRQFATEIHGDHSINISPNGTIPYGVLVHAIDAVREGRPGACVLPEDNHPENYSDPACFFPGATLGILRN